LVILQVPCLGDSNTIMQEGSWIFRHMGVMLQPYDGIADPSSIILNRIHPGAYVVPVAIPEGRDCVWGRGHEGEASTRNRHRENPKREARGLSPDPPMACGIHMENSALFPR
jgi:hypothetical protein